MLDDYAENDAYPWRARQDSNLQPLIRSQMLCPIELRAHAINLYSQRDGPARGFLALCRRFYPLKSGAAAATAAVSGAGFFRRLLPGRPGAFNPLRQTFTTTPGQEPVHLP